MSTPKPPYKGGNNAWLTTSLFWDKVVEMEVSRRLEHPPVFTLYDDKAGMINARKTFIELNDPTGYKWAMRYLGDFEHWKQLMKAKWFKAAYEDWILELHAKLQSEAINTIRSISQNEENQSQALTAAKYLAEQGWQKKRQVGRPSNEEVNAVLKEAAKNKSVEDEDFERIQLKVIK